MGDLQGEVELMVADQVPAFQLRPYLFIRLPGRQPSLDQLDRPDAGQDPPLGVDAGVGLQEFIELARQLLLAEVVGRPGGEGICRFRLVIREVHRNREGNPRIRLRPGEEDVVRFRRDAVVIETEMPKREKELRHILHLVFKLVACKNKGRHQKISSSAVSGPW